MWPDSPRHGPSGICAVAGLNLLPQPFCKCPSFQTLLGISQKVSRFTLVPKMWLICIIILVSPLSLSIVRLRAICLCGLPTLEYHASLWSSLLRLTLDGPCVVSFSSAFDLSSWTLSVFCRELLEVLGFPGGSVVKHLPAMQEMRVRSLGRDDTVEKEMATHSGNLAWRIPWTEEPGGLQSMGSQRVGHELATKQQLETLVY